MAFAVVAGLIVAALVVFGLQLRSTQSSSRDDLIERFTDAAANHAALTRSLFATTTASSAPELTRKLGGERVDPEALEALLRQGDSPYAFVADAEGNVLAASARTPAGAKGRIGEQPEYLSSAASGQGFGLSDSIPSRGGRSVIELATGFEAEDGTRRAFVSAIDPAMLSQFLSGYLEQTRRLEGGEAYITDSAGVVIAGSGRSDPADTDLLEQALTDEEGEYGNDRHFASVPIEGTGWRVIATAPTDELLSAVTGSSQLVPWVIFVFLAASALVAFTMSRRALTDADRLKVANERLGESNAALEHRARELQGSNEELEQAEGRLRHDALHDSLTGLPNRVLFVDRLRVALSRALRTGSNHAVLFVDIDRFKLINDSFSHAVGDELLIAAARRLDADLRPGDTVARLGGDEFTILLEGVESPEAAVHVAKRIDASLREPIRVSGQELSITASIGIALSDRDSEAAELMRNADIAMYAAKADSEEGVAVFDVSMHSRVVERLQVETELRRVLDERRLEVAYQPIIDLTKRRLFGFEALARWPQGSEFVAPAQFIPVAEDTGLIRPLGLTVLDGACEQLARWRRDGLVADDVTMSVNVSGRQLADPEFPGIIRAALERHELPGETLRIEMTESTVIDAPDHMREALDRIAKFGVRAQLDDFGTGYSSLTFLHHFSGDAIKIDRSFVTSMHTDEADEEIIRAIVELAHNLGLRVIAEGVEDSEQLAILKTMGCEYAQGYLFAKPLGPQDACEFLAAQEPSLAAGWA